MINSLARHVQLLSGPLATRHIQIKGQARGSIEPLCLLYVGSGASVAFLIKQFFATCVQTPLMTTATPIGVNSTLSRLDRTEVNLTVIERPPLWHWLNHGDADMMIPAWMSQVIELDGTRPAGKSVLPRLLAKEVGRHVRRSGFELEFTTDPAEMLDFYRDLYCPYVRSRFGDGAVLVGEEFFLNRARTQTLARLRQAGSVVAGILLQRRKSTLQFGWFGANTERNSPGASEVLDALVIEKAAAEGVRRVVFGHSRPSLSDGVVRYKRRFGAQLRATRFPQATISFHLQRWSEPLARCLNEAQFVGTKAGVAHLYNVSVNDDQFAIHTQPLESVTGATSLN